MEQTNENMSLINSGLVISSEANLNTFQTQQNLNITENATLTLSNAYHLSEIKQNETIINTAKKIIWAGFSILAIGIMLVFFGRTDMAMISVGAGIVTEFVSAIIFAFVSLSNKNKIKYFEQLSISEEGEKHMKVILAMDNKKAQEKLIDKMVTNYCERRKVQTK